MPNAIRMINLSLQIWGSFFLLVMFFSLGFLHRRRRREDHYFNVMLFSNIVVMTMDALAFYFRGKLDDFSSIMVRVTNFSSFAAAGVLIMAFALFLWEYIERRSEEPISKKPLYVIGILQSLQMAVLILNLFIPFAYKIGSDNLYVRQAGYPALFVFSFLSFIPCIWMIEKYRKCLTLSERHVFIFFILVPVVLQFVSLKVYGLALNQFGTTASLMMIYVFIQADYGKKVAEQEVRLVESQMTARMKQIRPHFIYNSLNAIRYLCEEDGEEAAEAIDHFASYLRFNTDRFLETDPIPLLEEIEHVKNYVYIENLRFPEVQVVYDLPVTDFKLPPLSLQPAIENSMKHGYTAKHSEGTILVQSSEDETNYYVKIQDDGVGFDPKAIPENDDKNHVGVENTRNRIEKMCKGTYEIMSSPGEGTTVLISIPKK